MIDIRSGRFHAILSAYLSIIAGLIEATLSLITGHAELSMSFYGIALMAVVDITGSALVLFIWQWSMTDDTEISTRHRIQEARYSYIIGAMMMILGLFLVADSAKTLIEGKSPHETSVGEGSGVALFGTLSSLSLSIYKYKVGHDLDSSVITADAVSTLCSALTSLVALVVVYNIKFYWWLDGMAGLLVAFYTLYSGAATMTSSSHQLGAFLIELEESEPYGGKGIQSPGYVKLMNKYRYSYQNDITPQESRARAYSGKPGGTTSTERTGLIEIMNARPTPYNFDNENRSQLSVFRLLYNQLHSNVFPSTEHRHGSMSYERIPASDSEDEVTFSA